MKTEDNKELVKRYIEEVVNTGDLGRIGEFVADGYAEVFDGKRYEIGIAGAKEHVAGVRRTYPNLVVTIELQIGEGEWVATSYVARGTHRGEWMGISPTGKDLSFHGVNIDRVRGGRIVEHGGAANMLGPLLEAGALKIAAKAR